jgi:peptide/nickel transport system substrate-binding protein
VQSGEADGVVGIPLAQLSAFERVSSLSLSSGVDYSVYKFNFDLTKKPWDDPHLRRAFAHAVDRDGLAEDLFKGNAEAAVTLVPPTVMEQVLPRQQVEDAYARIADEVPGFDLEAARRELAQSSTPDGVTTTLLITGSDPNLAAIAQTVAQDLEKVGIRLQIKQVDDNTYYNAVYFKHTTDGVSLENYGADGPDPSNIPSGALDSANGYPQGSGVNVSNYASPEVDALLARSRQLRQDDPRRGELLIDAQARAAQDTPFVPLVYPKVYLGLRDGLSWAGFNAFWWLSRWPADITAGS